jgi:hypothetical protein
MNIEIVTYILYLGISIGLTVWVAQTLHKSGRIFLVDVFHSNELAMVNHRSWSASSDQSRLCRLAFGGTTSPTQRGHRALSVVGTVMLVLGACTSLICLSLAACAAAPPCTTRRRRWFRMVLLQWRV